MAVLLYLTGFDLGIPTLLEIVLLPVVTYALAVFLTMIYFARIHKFKIAGPTFVPPLLGNLIAMIRDPYGFWDLQRVNATSTPAGYCWTSILNQFTVFATKPDICQKIFATNSDTTLTLALHPNGQIILGANNIGFQTGPKHKALRASFISLFTIKALSIYLPKQQKIINDTINTWPKKYPVGSGGTFKEMREDIRKLNCETSQTVFLGVHLDDPVAFTHDYDLMTNGFLTAPIYFPGTALYAAVQGRHRAMARLERAVNSSRRAMSKPNAEPDCLLDFWSIEVNEQVAQAKEAGEPEPHFANDHDMADSIMDFLFASQDASTASLTMITATMREHPEILARVVKEQDALRPNDEPLTYELVQEMTFTRACVLEQLRLQPPAPMVPMLAHGPFKIDDNFTAPKGSLIIPSIVGACREGFPEPDRYDPDRMGPERQEDRKFSKNFLPFGAGPHRCVGYNYAIIHLTIYLALVAKNLEWERKITKDSHKIIYLPTLYPADCLCKWQYREGRTAAK